MMQTEVRLHNVKDVSGREREVLNLVLNPLKKESSCKFLVNFCSEHFLFGEGL